MLPSQKHTPGLAAAAVNIEEPGLSPFEIKSVLSFGLASAWDDV